MILICTRDERLAKLLRRSCRGSVRLVTTLDRCVEVAADERPSVLLLDVRAGSNDELAIQRIPWIQRASPLTAVVVVTRDPDASEVEDLMAWGAYSYVDAVALDAPLQIRTAVDAARVASSSAVPSDARRRSHRLH